MLASVNGIVALVGSTSAVPDSVPGTALHSIMRCNSVTVLSASAAHVFITPSIRSGSAFTFTCSMGSTTCTSSCPPNHATPLYSTMNGVTTR